MTDLRKAAEEVLEAWDWDWSEPRSKYMNESEIKTSNPKPSEWICYMFGNKPETNFGISYRPTENNVPNRFVRWMMKICFACTWVKEKNK